MNGNGDDRHDPSPRPAGVRDIAMALGISIGTVDRALHSRRGVSPVTKKRVMQMAEDLGFRPNLAARFLSSRKQLTVKVCLPTDVAHFFDEVRQGIKEACKLLGLSCVCLLESSYRRIGNAEEETLENALGQDLDGIIISPAYPERMARLIRKASGSGVAVVCVSTDAPGTERLSTVAIDPFSSGSLAAELMGRFLNRTGTVATITGFLSTVDHAQKLAGFSHGAKIYFPGLQVRSPLETHDDEQEAYEKSSSLLTQDPALKGIYVSTANSLPTLRALNDLGRKEQVTVITTDLFPAIVPYIRSGAVAATLHQRPRTQGRMAFEALFQFLMNRQCPPPFTKLTPHVVMRSNLDLFLDQISGRLSEDRERF